jgi:DNA-binding FadR family transcriptional regulator
MKKQTKSPELQGRFRPSRRPQLVSEIISELRSRLAAGELKVGDKLPPENILVSELGVGRTTLREAVRVLEHAGLLTVRHGSGTYVRSTSDEGLLASRLRQGRVLEVFEVRRALEIEMMRIVAAYRTSPTLAAMRDTLDLMRKNVALDDERGFLDADMEMYRILAAATRNSIFMEIYASFAEALRLALTQVVAIPSVMQNCLESHERLYEAIAARDADRAEAIAKGHLDRVSRVIENVLGDALINDAVKSRTAVREAPIRN